MKLAFLLLLAFDSCSEEWESRSWDAEEERLLDCLGGDLPNYRGREEEECIKRSGLP